MSKTITVASLRPTIPEKRHSEYEQLLAENDHEQLLDFLNSVSALHGKGIAIFDLDGEMVVQVPEEKELPDGHGASAIPPSGQESGKDTLTYWLDQWTVAARQHRPVRGRPVHPPSYQIGVDDGAY